jgi:signal transduction histidine kinase
MDARSKRAEVDLVESISGKRKSQDRALRIPFGNHPVQSRRMSVAAKIPWPLDGRERALEPAQKTQEEIDPKAESVKQSEGVNSHGADGWESVGRLAGSVAHDFNNLLTGVLLYCDLLLALEPAEPARKYAEEIRNAGQQAAGLVRQLLAVARPCNSDPRLLSLNQVAEDMRDLMARLIGESIELQFHLDPTLGRVRMNPTQTQQVLLNLILNARDAMPAGGTITVSTRNCQIQILADQVPADQVLADQVLADQVLTDQMLADQVLATAQAEGHRVLPVPGAARRIPALPCALFVVADNGKGMDAVTQSHLFEVFYTTKPAGKGNGLGLATVHDIVTANGGLIHVDSAPERGTRITVLLPLVPQTTLNSRSVTELPQQPENEGPLAPK